LLSFSLGGDFVPGGEVNDIVIADLNRDGRPDVATVDYRGENASVLLGDGTGALAPAQHFPLNSSGLQASIAVADLTGDAVPDLVTANGTDRLSLLAGNGDGSFQGPRIVSVPPPPA